MSNPPIPAPSNTVAGANTSSIPVPTPLSSAAVILDDSYTPAEGTELINGVLTDVIYTCPGNHELDAELIRKKKERIALGLPSWEEQGRKRWTCSRCIIMIVCCISLLMIMVQPTVEARTSDFARAAWMSNRVLQPVSISSAVNTPPTPPLPQVPIPVTPPSPLSTMRIDWVSVYECCISISSHCTNSAICASVPSATLAGLKTAATRPHAPPPSPIEQLDTPVPTHKVTKGSNANTPAVSLMGTAAASRMSTDTTATSDSQLWPHGLIYWKFADSLIHMPDKTRVYLEDAYLEAMATWRQLTCLQFQMVLDGEPLPPHFVEFNYTEIGNAHTTVPIHPITGQRMLATQVKLKLRKDRVTGAFIDEIPASGIHELGHVIGLEHTTQRADRDQFIHLDYSRTGLGAYCDQGMSSPRQYFNTQECQSFADRAERESGFLQTVANNPTHPFSEPVREMLRYYDPPSLVGPSSESTTTKLKNGWGKFWSVKKPATREFMLYACAYVPCMNQLRVQYAVLPASESTLYTAYDFDSIMHYPLDTGMTPIPAQNPSRIVPGNRLVPSALDFESVHQKYKCGIKVRLHAQIGVPPQPKLVERYYRDTTTLAQIHSSVALYLRADPMNTRHTQFTSAELEEFLSRSYRRISGEPPLDQTRTIRHILDDGNSSPLARMASQLNLVLE